MGGKETFFRRLLFIIAPRILHDIEFALHLAGSRRNACETDVVKCLPWSELRIENHKSAIWILDGTMNIATTITVSVRMNGPATTKDLQNFIGLVLKISICVHIGFLVLADFRQKC